MLCECVVGCVRGKKGHGVGGFSSVNVEGEGKVRGRKGGLG